MAELSLEAEGVVAPSVVLFKKRSSRPKGNVGKRLATPVSSQTDDTPDYPSSEDDWLQRHRVKRRRQNTGVIIPTSAKNPSTELFPTVLQADRNVPLNATNDATKGSNWFDENTKIGPTQAPTNVRTTTATDFAPDVCKDYKTTGWCDLGIVANFFTTEAIINRAGSLIESGRMSPKGRKTWLGPWLRAPTGTRPRMTSTMKRWLCWRASPLPALFARRHTNRLSSHDVATTFASPVPLRGTREIRHARHVERAPTQSSTLHQN
jgi:hypothetical protein